MSKKRKIVPNPKAKKVEEKQEPKQDEGDVLREQQEPKQDEGEALREQAVDYFYSNKRSAHNPFHPRNGSVYSMLSDKLRFLSWYRIDDVAKWTNDMELQASDDEVYVMMNTQSLEMVYSFDGHWWRTQRDYPDEHEIGEEDSDFQRFTDWFEDDWFNDIEETGELTQSMTDLIGISVTAVNHVSFAQFNDALNQFKFEAKIRHARADRDYIQIMRDKIGEK